MTKRKRGFGCVQSEVVTKSSSTLTTENGIVPLDVVHNAEKNQITVVTLSRPTNSLVEVVKTLSSEEAEGTSKPLGESETPNCHRTESTTATISGFNLRSSVRTQKRSHVEDGTATMTVTSSNPLRKRVIAAAAAKRRVRVQASEKGKPRRSWELWSVEDKKTFFEALCEYGKDFESIRAYVVQKTRKKGSPVIKNKDQVRHFYYRTWHKISKYLNISDDVKKPTQELYGLINYGEMRRKLGGRLGEKNGRKLNELVHEGVTIIRCKGKNLRVKTPVCRALKRLVDIEDLKEEENRKLPARIDIEFRPLNNRAWTRVQSVAQNPRLRMSVSLQQRLSTVIAYLQTRWIEPALKQRRELLERAAIKRNEVDNGEPLLTLRPRSDATLCDMSIKATTEVTSSCVSLQNYRRKILGLSEPAPSTTATMSSCKKVQKGKRRTSAESKKTSAIGEDVRQVQDDVTSSPCDASVKKTRRKHVSGAVNNLITHKPEEEGDAKKSSEGESTHELTLRQLLALETAVADPISTKPADEALFARAPSFLTSSLVQDTADCPLDVTAPPIKGNLEKVDAKAVLSGWTASTCGALTVGEIYLMLGAPSKLLLEYVWEYPPPPPPPPSSTSANVDELPEVTSWSYILGRLLSIASTIVTEGGRHKPDRLLSNQSSTSSTASCRCSHQQSCHLAASSAAKSNISKSSSACRNSSTMRGTSKSTTAQKAAVTGVVPSSSRGRLILPAIPAADSTPPSPQTSTAALNTTEIFRKPTLSPVQNRIAAKPSDPVSSATRAENQLTNDKEFQEQLYKYRRTKGRSGNPMVVQRELLPKATAAHSMMTLSIIPSASQLAGSFMPVLTSRPTALNTVTSVVPLSRASTTTAKVIRFAPRSLPVSSLALPIGALPPPPPLPPRATIPLASTTPCTVLISSDRVQKTGIAITNTTTTSSPLVLTTVASRTSFANRLTAMPMKMNVFPTVATTTVSVASQRLPNLTSFPISNLNLQGTSVDSSSIPVMSIAEPKIRSNLSVSPPTISSLLDMSLTGTDTSPLTEMNLGCETCDISTDKLMDLNLGNSNSFSGLIDLTLIGKSNLESIGDSVLLSNTTLCGDTGLDPRPSTPANSPTNSLFKFSSPGLESHWLNGDTSDFSLSNLLNHLESPIKVSASASVHSEGMDAMARLAPDMDSQLRSLISESSIDYIAKFEDLAAQIGKK